MTIPTNPLNDPLFSTVDPLLLQSIVLSAKIEAIIKVLIEAKLTTSDEMKKETDANINKFLDQFDNATKGLKKAKQEKPKLDLNMFDDNFDIKKVH